MALKSGYVRLVHAARVPASAVGLLGLLERNRDRPLCAWMRSLFAIHDFDDMIHLGLPWWCFAAATEIDRFLADRPNARVIEYGSGASTVWLAQRAGEVISIEHDEPWYRRVASRAGHHQNLRILFRAIDSDRDDPAYRSAKAGWRGESFKHYVHAIDHLDGTFDLAVIDGRARSRCLEAVLPRLAPGARVLFDNSGRRRYRTAIENSQMREEVFWGLTPGLPYPSQTSVLRVESAA